MASFNEVKWSALTAKGFTSGSLNEREYAWLASETGLTDGRMAELWIALMESYGFTEGRLDELQFQFWTDLGYTGSWGEMAYDWWNDGAPMPGGGVGPVVGDGMLLESGGTRFLLLESGDFLLLE